MNDGGILLDILNPSAYDYIWSPDAGVSNADNNETTQLVANRYQVTITDKTDANCSAEASIDVNYSCVPAIDTFFAYVPFNGSAEICMDAAHINLPKSASSSFMCNDGSGTNPPAVLGSTTANPECIMLEALNGFVGKFPEMLCVCLLYTSPSPRDRQKSRMPSSA